MFLLFSEQDNYISLEYELLKILDSEILQRTIKSLLKHEIEDSSREDYSVSFIASNENSILKKSLNFCPNSKPLILRW